MSLDFIRMVGSESGVNNMKAPALVYSTPQRMNAALKEKGGLIWHSRDVPNEVSGECTH